MFPKMCLPHSLAGLALQYVTWVGLRGNQEGPHALFCLEISDDF
jgi:hypothetical protein